MNAFEFLEEMNGIDEELILNAQTVPRRAMRRIGLRAAVLAAALCLLTVSVAAVTIGVRIWTGNEQVVHFEHDFGGLFPFTSKVATIEYDLHPQNTRLPLGWQQELTVAWKSFGYSHEHFSGIDLRTDDGRRVNFGGISELERLFDLELHCNERLRRTAERSFLTLAVTDSDRCADQLRNEGTVTPDGLVVYLPIDSDREDIDYCGLSIYIPLTESFAQIYSSHAVLSSVYMQDLKQTTVADAILLVNEAGEGDPMSGFAAWESGGIGYLLELKTTADADLDVVELLTPYLTETEEEK